MNDLGYQVVKINVIDWGGFNPGSEAGRASLDGLLEEMRECRQPVSEAVASKLLGAWRWGEANALQGSLDVHPRPGELT
jgi:hypothetical protein